MPVDILDKAKAALEGCDVDGAVACYGDESGRRGLLWGSPAHGQRMDSRLRGNDREKAREARRSGLPPTR